MRRVGEMLLGWLLLPVRLVVAPWIWLGERWSRRSRRRGSLWNNIGWLLALPVVFPAMLLGRLFQTLWRHWTRAGTSRALWGLPAMMALVATAWVVYIRYGRPPAVLSAVYSQAGETALDEKRYDAAQVYLERLVQLDGERPKTLYQLARALDGKGNQQDVELLLARLAPRQKAGYAPAHLWLATRLFQKVQLSQEEVHTAEAHLQHVLFQDQNNVEAQAMLGQICFAAGRWQETQAHLGRIVSVRPDLRLTLAKSYAAVKNVAEARRIAVEAQQFFRTQSQNHPQDAAIRISWAEATMFLEEFPEAVAILEQGALRDNPTQYYLALGRVYVAWYDTASAHNALSTEDGLKLIEAGLRANPSESLLFDRLLNELEQGEERAQRARECLQRMLAEGQSLGLVHMALGMDAGDRDDHELAVFHFERACQLDSAFPVVINNLAWFLAHREPPEYERALSLMEPLLKVWPKNEHFRDTRGEILARLGRWREALGDLEFALPLLRGDSRLHRRLAEAYQHLGQRELAKQHESIAARLEVGDSKK